MKTMIKTYTTRLVADGRNDRGYKAQKGERGVAFWYVSSSRSRSKSVPNRLSNGHLWLATVTPIPVLLTPP